MRKINLENYMIESNNGLLPYDIKSSLIGILFHPDLKLGAVELLLRNKLANKINDSEVEILLEETDYLKLKTAIEIIKGYVRNDVEFVERILNAEEIEVVER